VEEAAGTKGANTRDTAGREGTECIATASAAVRIPAGSRDCIGSLGLATDVTLAARVAWWFIAFGGGAVEVCSEAELHSVDLGSCPLVVRASEEGLGSMRLAFEAYCLACLSSTHFDCLRGQLKLRHPRLPPSAFQKDHPCLPLNCGLATWVLETLV
jgi:hypothetical protein